MTDFINVKDYGAKGDGNTDDTAAIQNAFDEAFGTWDNPRLITYVSSSKPVFFPSGTYIVSPPDPALEIVDCTDKGGGVALIEFDSKHNFKTGDGVYVRGSTGNTWANGPHWITVVDSRRIDLGINSFNAKWTGGGTVCKPCLRLKGVDGATIYGTSRAASVVKTNTPDCVVLHCNGLRYSTLRDLSLVASPGGLTFDLNWDNIVACSTQGNQLHNVQIDGSADIGLAIGWNGFMSSETGLIHCQIGGCKIGVYLGNYNATNTYMSGGQIQQCVTGVLAAGGGDMTRIDGVSFQNTTNTDGWDVQIDNTAGNGWCITNCRSESVNFVKCGPDIAVTLDTCSLMGGVGYFYSGAGRVTMQGCYNPNGAISCNGYLIVDNCRFGEEVYSKGNIGDLNYFRTTPQQVIREAADKHLLYGSDLGGVLRMESSSPQIVEVPAGYHFGSTPGNVVTIQQAGIGQVTVSPKSGVTVNSANGLKTRAQHSVIYLTSEGSEVWTLSGDSA